MLRNIKLSTMKKTVITTLIVFCGGILAPALSAEVKKKSLFHIKRNKNRNQVHYGIKYDAAQCKPAGDEPVYAYWLDLEVGPNVVNPIGSFEKIAYGIKSQKMNGEALDLRLKALPEKALKVKFEKSGSACNVNAYTQISGNDAQMKEIYVFAEEGIIKPTVKYVDIFGKAGSKFIKERINKD